MLGGGGVEVIVVRVCEPVFRNLPYSYTWPFDLWKNGPIHILDRPKCWPIHILPFDFYTHLLLVVRQLSQSIYWIPREQEVSKNRWTKNIRIYRDVRIAGPFKYEPRKIGSVTLSWWKKGANHIPGSAEKRWPFGTSVLCHTKEVTLLPRPHAPPPPPPHPAPRDLRTCGILFLCALDFPLIQFLRSMSRQYHDIITPMRRLVRVFAAHIIIRIVFHLSGTWKQLPLTLSGLFQRTTNWWWT